jgi:putative colanic acid biosynthesis UDP-glucose lipid carrier transferase
MTIQDSIAFSLDGRERVFGRQQAFGAVAPLLRGSPAKRALDLFGAGFGLIFLLPLLLLIGLLIKLSSPGPVLFRQRRTGYDGKVFQIYKFRTMCVLEDGDDVTHATRCDRRTTAFGALLRRSSLDELPQLLNVLTGDMSLVGPRPHAVKHDNYYRAVVGGYDLRFLAKPGITGLAQVSGFRGEITSVQNMADRVALDLVYIGNWSLLLDAKILAQTLLLTPFHDRAY